MKALKDHKFFKNYTKAIREEKNLKPLSYKKVLNLDKKVIGNGFHKRIFDQDLYKLIKEKKIKLPERIYFEAVYSQMAQNTAYEARRFLKKAKPSKKSFLALEFCTGSGSQTYAFVKKGFDVFTVDRNAQILKWAKENFKKLKIKGNDLVFHLGSLEDFFKDRHFKTTLGSNKVDLIYADPPWGGSYYKSLESTFLWEYMNPDGRDIVRECIDKAVAVCLKLPFNMPIELIYDLVKQLKLSALVINQELVLGERVIKERVVFFSKQNYLESAFEIRENKL